mmetsp:Transcript_21826/g.21117  ORF Transcript_21826/g.21117 Transcript_21826/m.21117 type:complete len:90 (-) Transcript_21826:61-330(-)
MKKVSYSTLSVSLFKTNKPSLLPYIFGRNSAIPPNLTLSNLTIIRINEIIKDGNLANNNNFIVGKCYNVNFISFKFNLAGYDMDAINDF